MAGRKAATATAARTVLTDRAHGNAPIIWRYVKCAGYDTVIGTDGKENQEYHHFSGKECNCSPGPTVQALASGADETALVGGRGSMKTECVLAWLIRGNPHGKASNPVDVSYTNTDKYTALILRRTQVDLDDFYRRAKQFYGALGAVGTENPYKIRFPHPTKPGQYGAEFDFGHMQDEESFQKHQGKTYTRMVIEEAGHIPTEKLYLRTIMSCRSVDPQLKAQVFITANPGGPGNKWLKARFLDLRKPDGTQVKSGETYKCPVTGRTRKFIHSTVYDNPYFLRDNGDYVRQLEMLPEVERQRWLFGNFNAVEGQYFDLRREPRPGEPPEACHVIKANSVVLEPWWPRAIGLDWGYGHKAVAVGGCWSPKGQLHIYREHAVSRVGTVQLGVEIASKWWSDLEKMPVPHLSLYLSHDAFAKTDDAPTEAQQIASGIERVLGKDAAFVVAPDDDERDLPQDEAWSRIARRRRERAAKTHITIQRAAKNSPGTWNLLREYLRWWKITKSGIVFDEAMARRILETEGALAWKEYRDACEQYEAEVLPKILFWDSCKETIDAVEGAVEDENNREKVLKQDGDDPLDALSYLAAHFTFSEATLPKDVYISEHLRKVRGDTPGVDTNSLVMAARSAEWSYDKQNRNMTGFVLARSAGPARRAAMTRRVN
jgi:hypothetical protein